MDVAFQMVVNGLVAGCSHGLLALSFSLIYCTARFFHLAHAASYTIGAYAALFLAISLGVTPVVAVIAGTVAAATVGLVMELAIYLPLRDRGGKPLVLLLASIGILVVLQNSVSLAFGDAIRSMPATMAREGFELGNARITGIQITLIATSLVAFAVVQIAIKKTWWGRRVRAVVEDESLASAVGIDTKKVISVAFVVGSALAGLAASLAAYDTGLRPTMGFNALLLAVVAMVVGGVGNVSAAYLGGLLVGVLQQVSALLLPTKWQEAVVFALLVSFLLFRPQGLLGTSIQKAAV